MRTLTTHTVAGLSVLWLFLLPFATAPANSAWATPFELRILDQDTGAGVSHIRLTSDNGIVCYTRPDGSVLWTESALMDREVSFRIDTSAGPRMVTVRVTPGGYSEVEIGR